MFLRGVFNGITGDSAGSVWASNSLTREIYQYDSAVHGFRLTTISNAASITSLVFDSATRYLYASDPIGGVLFAVKIDTKELVKITDKLGDIRGPAVGKQSHPLFVADASRKIIWSVPGSGKASKPTKF